MRTACCVLIFASFGFGQQFEVASIKPSDPNPTNRLFVGMKADAGTVHYSNITLRDCLRAAYRVRDFQIQGPDWMSTARFEIIAKLPAGASMEQIPEMMQALLAERFGLVLEHGTKEQSVYALVAGKDGPKLKPPVALPDTSETVLGVDGRPRQMITIGIPTSGIVIHGSAASLATMVDAISRFTLKPVVDMTGVQGQHQFDLTFEPETMGSFSSPRVSQDGSPIVPGDPAPPLSAAIQEYGLKLETRKAPIEMLTVTHVEKTPTDN